MGLGSLASAHRLDDGRGADIAGTMFELLPVSVPGVSTARNWLEVGAGVRLPGLTLRRTRKTEFS